VKGLLRYRKLLFIIVPLLLVVCVAGYIFLPLPIPKLLSVEFGAPTETPAAENKITPTPAAGHTTAAAVDERGPMYEIRDIVVNLQEPGGRRYLKATVVLEFEPPSAAYNKLVGEAKTKAQTEFLNEITPKNPVIQDTIITLFSSKTVNEIFTLEGKVALKEDLHKKLNAQLGKDQVVNIYLTQFVIQ
jgi:flagellar FliL protein